MVRRHVPAATLRALQESARKPRRWNPETELFQSFAREASPGR